LGKQSIRNERGSMIPIKDITVEYLAGVDTVNYSDLPLLKICPTILDYVSEDICDLLKRNRPHNYVRERINKHMLWDLSNKRIHSGSALRVKFQGQPIWEESALLRWAHNKQNPNSLNKEKGLQLEHNNERIWYTNSIQQLDSKDNNLHQKVKDLLSTTTCTVVTPEFHKSLPSSITDPQDPWKRYRPFSPSLYWITWKKERTWSIETIQKIII